MFSATTLAIGVTGLEQELLLERLVGKITVSTTSTNNTPGAVGIGFAKTQVPTALTVGGFQDPLISSELGTVDWLRIMNTQLPPNAGTNGYIWSEPFDIRVRRRMKQSDAIACLAIQATGVNNVIITIDTRILIVIRM